MRPARPRRAGRELPALSGSTPATRACSRPAPQPTTTQRRPTRGQFKGGNHWSRPGSQGSEDLVNTRYRHREPTPPPLPRPPWPVLPSPPRCLWLSALTVAACSCLRLPAITGDEWRVLAGAWPTHRSQRTQPSESGVHSAGTPPAPLRHPYP